MRKMLTFFLSVWFFLQVLPACAVTLTAEKPVEFKFSGGEETVTFELNHPGDRFLAIEVEFGEGSSADAGLKVEGQNTVKAGPVVWNNIFNRDVYAHDGPSSIIDNLKPAPGIWKIDLKAISSAVSGRCRLRDFGPVTKIDYTEKTGVIQIRRPDNHDIIAFGDVYHPDFPASSNEFAGSVNAEGDVVIPVPVGFYSLRQASPLVGLFQANLIPVHGGKITVVENWPKTIQPDAEEDGEKVAAALASGTMQLERELKIRSVKLLENDNVRIRFATPNWQGVVSREELEAHEGGMKGEVVSAGTVATPLSLTILLDSSGSMKSDMKLALASVEQFIKLLPTDSEVNLIDFDTKAKEVSSKDRAGLLKSLKAIKADGATCLNDSVMLGLKKSAGRGRPAVLLFTDGFDANHNDTGPGSKTKPEEMFSAAGAAEVPVFTIGFGSKPDEATLKRLATLSGGTYNRANKDNIAKVFAQVASILGREHEMVYKRPGIKGNSDAPVISVVLDVSGSMNMPPTEEGCDYRIEKAKAILRDLFAKLPENAIVQLTTYNLYINVPQTFTSDKMQLLTGLSQVDAAGGTETLGALQIAFKMLNEVPTDRKYLLFITDAGLELDPAAVSPDYEATLGSIRDAGIQTTWIGMVDATQKAPFDAAARLCNGKAVVSTDLEAVREAVDNFGRSILNASATADNKIPVQLSFSRKKESGSMLIMNASEKAELPPPPVVSKAVVNGLRFSTTDMPQSLERYNLELSQSLYGNSQTREDTVITQRMPLKVTGKNGALNLTVSEMLLMSKFRGILLPCVALKLRLENILPEQEIPADAESQAGPAGIISKAGESQKMVKAVPTLDIADVRMHFFAKFNNLEAVPVSDLSWLVEDPLITSDAESLSIQGGESVEGWLVFEYDSDAIIQNGSLTFYDTANGNLQVPLLGVHDNADQLAAIARLPEAPEGSLSSAFKLKVLGLQDKAMVEPLEQLTRRVFDLQIISQVQALLDINPVERFSLLVSSRFGDLVLALSPRTGTLPMGWFRPRLFVPGSNNHLRQAYVLPKSLGKLAKGTLRVDIADGEILLPAGDKPVKADKPVAEGKGDRISLAVNAFQFGEKIVYLDLTLTDEKDGEGTSVQVADLCRVEIAGTVFPPKTEEPEYMFQMIDQVEVADGHCRRFLLVIPYEEDAESASVTLKSDLFKMELSLKRADAGKIDEYMFAGPDNWSDKLQAKEDFTSIVAKVNAERLARGWKRKGAAIKAKALSLKSDGNASDSSDLTEDGVILPPPGFKSALDRNMQELFKQSPEAFLKAIREIRCVPTEECLAGPVYAPEAVLMQNWGTQNDLLELARQYFKRAGMIVADGFKLVALTDRGKEELFKMTGWKTGLTKVPVLTSGDQKIVAPFMLDISALSEIVEADSLEDADSLPAPKASISISLRVRPRNSGEAAMMGSMGDALGGGADDDNLHEIPLFETEAFDYEQFSKAPVDIFYFSPDSGKTLIVSGEGASGRLENLVEPVSLADNEIVEEKIDLKLDGEVLSYVRPLEKGVSLVDTFRTIAFCMPDISASASQAISEEFAARRSSEAPGTRSTARWFTRAKIFQFLAMHSEAEAEAVCNTGVKIGRPAERMRAVILTLTAEKDSVRASFDLRQINPVVQGEENAVRAFNFFMGMANTLIEDQVMGGGSLFSRWYGNKDQRLLVAGPDDIDSLIAGINGDMLPEHTIALLRQAQEKGQGVIFPTMAPQIDGKARPAWFAFNPQTYEMVSVLDNGTHGSMVERPINEIISDAAKYSVGFLIGTNVSLWSVVTYSIKYDDMRLVVKAAKALSLAIAEQIKDVGKPLQALLPEIPTSYTAHEVEASAGPVSVKVGFANLSADGFKLMTKPSIDFNFSYQSGFEDAVKLYFKDSGV